MDKLERLKKATGNVNRILQEKLPELPYFDNTNFNINAKTFKRSLVYGQKISLDNQLALYSSKLNTLLIDEENLTDNISDEQLELLILHELIHMASTNLENQTIGFESEVLPITYNEGLTQWLTLKLYYGKEKLKEAISKNIIYPETVKKIDSVIEKYGENTIFNGFFESDINKNIDNMPGTIRNKLLYEILTFVNSNEEKISKASIIKLNDKINNFKDNKKDSDPLEL